MRKIQFGVRSESIINAICNGSSFASKSCENATFSTPEMVDEPKFMEFSKTKPKKKNVFKRCFRMSHSNSDAITSFAIISTHFVLRFPGHRCHFPSQYYPPLENNKHLLFDEPITIRNHDDDLISFCCFIFLFNASERKKKNK